MQRAGQKWVRWRMKLGAKLVIVLSAVVGVGVHVLAEVHTPPPRLRYLHDAMFVSLAFVHLAGGAVVLNVRQWELGRARERKKVD